MILYKYLVFWKTATYGLYPVPVLDPFPALDPEPQRFITALHYWPVFLNVYGAQELAPRNEFRQPMQPYSC